MPPTDQDLARASWVNLLAIGTAGEVAKLVTSLWPYLVRPIEVRLRDEPLRLLPTSPPVGTLVIYDVDTLTRLEQHALKRWLTIENPGARVVSSASSSLWPMVQAGAFNDDLYYRLNVVTIDLTSPVASQLAD